MKEKYVLSPQPLAFKLENLQYLLSDIFTDTEWLSELSFSFYLKNYPRQQAILRVIRDIER